jgi:hypothetical protein
VRLPHVSWIVRVYLTVVAVEVWLLFWGPSNGNLDFPFALTFVPLWPFAGLLYEIAFPWYSKSVLFTILEVAYWLVVGIANAVLWSVCYRQVRAWRAGRSGRRS